MPLQSRRSPEWTITPPTKRHRSEKWLGSRPRWRVHLTPTASCWFNLVERFFADIIEKQIRRGTYRSTAELAAIKRLCLKTLEIA